MYNLVIDLFRCDPMSMNFLLQFKHTIIMCSQKKFILKHTILYVHCVDLLMWSPAKLDFPFYDLL